MRWRPAVLVVALAPLAFGCQGREPAPVASPPATPAPAGLPTAAPPAATEAPAASAPSPAGLTGIAGPALASQETNWPGITADVTEFRRRGNTLTARLRLRNRGAESAEPDIHWDDTYVMDAAGAKKYEVLRDEKGQYIAALRTGYSNRWYQRLQPAQEVTVWMKFPAPPPEVKAVTLQVPGMPPFDELAIQDS